MSKISLFHLSILQIWPILESFHQTGHNHFWPRLLQKFSITLCVKSYQHEKKSVNSINPFFRYSQFWSPETKLATTIFNHAQPKTFRSTFNFCEFVSTCKKWGCFIDLFWTNGWFKKLAIWMAESILAYSSGITFFPKKDLCRNTANNIKFCYKTNSGKLMTKSFFKFKKPYFWPILHLF